MAPSSRPSSAGAGGQGRQQYGSFFGVLAVIPLIFSSVFLTDLSSPIVLVLCLFPLTAPMAMLKCWRCRRRRGR
jgi:ABC-type Na+ efflux pump permease subunit